MKVITRTESIPSCGKTTMEILTKRALKCGFKIVNKLNRTIGEIEYTTFVLEGSRLAAIRYYGIDILSGNFGKFRNIPGLLKLMFL